MDFLRSEARQRAILAAWRRRAAAEEAANLSRNLSRYSGVAFDDNLMGAIGGGGGLGIGGAGARRFNAGRFGAGLGRAGAGLVRAGLGMGTMTDMGMETGIAGSIGMGSRRMMDMGWSGISDRAPLGALDGALAVQPSLRFAHS